MAYSPALLHDVGKLLTVRPLSSSLRHKRRREVRRCPTCSSASCSGTLHEPPGGLAVLRWGMAGGRARRRRTSPPSGAAVAGPHDGVRRVRGDRTSRTRTSRSSTGTIWKNGEITTDVAGADRLRRMSKPSRKAATRAAWSLAVRAGGERVTNKRGVTFGSRPRDGFPDRGRSWGRHTSCAATEHTSASAVRATINTRRFSTLVRRPAPPVSRGRAQSPGGSAAPPVGADERRQRRSRSNTCCLIDRIARRRGLLLEWRHFTPVANLRFFSRSTATCSALEHAAMSPVGTTCAKERP